jgi:hypothetical protein
METFVGLDVSLKDTSVCVLNQTGTLVFEGKIASEPKAIARLIRKHATNVARVGLESGPTSVWLSHALLAEGLPVVCLDACRAVDGALNPRNPARDARWVVCGSDQPPWAVSAIRPADAELKIAFPLSVLWFRPRLTGRQTGA